MKILILLLVTSSCFAQDFYTTLAKKAESIMDWNTIYSSEYVRIPYPNGDVAAGRGVCTDVVIRAYRKVGIDLQKEVHEDMVSDFASYPQIWGMSGPDTNIDHRRVPNLMTFFKRAGASLPKTLNPNDYKPGDVVCWSLYGGVTHIGIVTTQKSVDGVPLVIHNIGLGQVIQDVLFKYKIIGHYRYDKI